MSKYRIYDKFTKSFLKKTYASARSIPERYIEMDHQYDIEELKPNGKWINILE